MFSVLQTLKEKLPPAVVVVVAVDDHRLNNDLLCGGVQRRVGKALKQQQLNKMGFLRGGRGAMDADREQIRG